MELKFYNCPEPQPFDASLLPRERPAFLDYQPDWQRIEEVVETFGRYRNIIILGNGGSISSIHGMYGALQDHAGKSLYIINTVEPDYIHELKSKLRIEDTVIIPISKSGETVTIIESLMHFAGYPMIFIVGPGTPLAAIGNKWNATMVDHPPIGGRYTGMTDIHLLPAALCGFPVRDIFAGAQEMYRRYERSNIALQAASVFAQLEHQGYLDVFMPIYSHYLFPFSALIVQLCHESFGKKDKGQTYLVAEAPESQHHTNQRFFGGPKNMGGWFVSVDRPMHDTMTRVPAELHGIPLKNQPVVTLDKIPLNEALQAELHGTIDDAKIQGIPVAHLSLPARTPEIIGSYLAFWQLYAVYASLVRGVDPFDQPQVEASKILSFNKRLQYKGLL